MLVPYATVAAIFASTVFAQSTPDPSINTPAGVTQCEVSALTWSGTHPPFTISISGTTNVAPLVTILQSTNTTSDSWLCNVAQGTYITFEIRDSQGNLDYSAPITVLGSTDSSCIGQNTTTTPSTPTNTGSSSVSSSTPITSVSISSVSHSISTPVSSGSSSVNKGSSSLTTSTTSSGTSTSSSSSSTHKGGGAMPTAAAAQWGVAGLVGLVGAAVLA